MKAYLYLLNTLADWETGYITAELHSKRYLDKSKEISLIKIGSSSEPVTTMGGITITPDENIENIKFRKDDILILPGADTWADESNMRIIDIVSEIINTGVIVAAICGATIALANKGLLNNRKHTSNSMEYLEMVCPGYTGSGYYINEPAVADGNLITATGLAPLEFAYQIIKKANLMKPDTVNAWHELNRTREPEYFFALMDSIK